MSDSIKLSGAQLAQVRAMGLCDPAFKHACDAKDDGVVRLADQSPEFASLDSYRAAFENLAKLAGKPEALDAADFAKLETPAALADAVTRDPTYRMLVAREAALEFGKREIPVAFGNEAIPPRHYRRMMALVQMALKKVVDPAVGPDGDFGKGTQRALADFQQKLGIAPADGKLAGPKTIGRLLMRLRYSRDELLAKLEQDRKGLQTMGAFFMGSAEGEVKVQAQGHVMDALKWLGYLGESIDTSSFPGSNEAAVVLQQRFDGANLVGPRIVEQIIERVKALPF